MSNFMKMPLTGQTEEVNVLGVPFTVVRENDAIKNLPLNQKIPMEAQEPCSYAFLLGMVQDNPEGSEWWQQSEYTYCAQSERVFIGDDLCFVFIVYEDNTQEIVPAIFGYNVWNYELFHKIKPYEKNLRTYGGPYREPFESDPEAQKLFDQSLCLNENPDGEKGSKYVMAVKLKNKKVKLLNTRKFPGKLAGLYISSMTCLPEGAGLPPEIKKVVDPAIFLNRGWQKNAEKLARRLYQFKDDIPEKVEHFVPEGYRGPVVNFEGNNVADLLTNLYHVNMHDMIENKVTEDKMPHTSSGNAANFGGYVGFGTFAMGEGGYFKHIWTRDVGRLLIELSVSGANYRVRGAAETMHKYLYDPSVRFSHPNWKRIANSNEVFGPEIGFCGKENDGHAAIMLFIYHLIRTGAADFAWAEENKKQIMDAADWFFWQMDNPAESDFDKVLYSDSEASAGEYGGYDLFSNAISYYALVGYGRIGEMLGWDDLKEKCFAYAETLKKGIYEVFVQDNEKYGKIFVDNNYDAWTYEYKRFGLLFEMADVFGYEPLNEDDTLKEIALNTMRVQKDEFYTPYSGRQMGYGQGYLTQTMLLMDDVAEYTNCVEATAYYCYHNHDSNYIVPEGVITHPTKRYWFRNCDQGNGVQQAETIKSVRLVLGIEDLYPEKGINIIPRMPQGFTKMTADNYAVVQPGVRQVKISYGYEKVGDQFKMTISAPEEITVGTLRFGPYPAGKTSDKGTVKTIGGYDYVYVPVNSKTSSLELTV